MVRKHIDVDAIAAKLDEPLERRVKEWAKYAEFRHLTGPQCPKCKQTTYLFKPEDTDGFCVNCFNKRWPHPVRESGSKKSKEDKRLEGMKIEDDKAK